VRITYLIDYFKEYADYLVVELFPEDTQALDDTVNQVTAI
jgi:hypothetical protein